MIKISSVVVLYGSKIRESRTLNSILNTYNDDIKLTIHIWNNGPNKLEKNDLEEYFKKNSDKDITVDIHEDTRNIALSKIYNFFIKKYDYDFICFLDQDSELQKEFYTNIVSNQQYDMVCPVINTLSNPLIQECPIYFKDPNVKVKLLSSFKVGEILTISSGLALSKKLLRNIEEGFGNAFNENFALYFIDTDLFSRLRHCPKMEGICIGKIVHDLTLASNVNVNNMSQRVKLERGYGKILNRYYISQTTNKSFFSMLVYVIKLTIKDKYSFKDAINLFKCTITKKHPRCKYNISANKLSDYTNN